MSTSDPPLTVNSYRDAVLTPAEHIADRFQFRFGGFAADGTPIDEFRLARHWGVSAPAPFRNGTFVLAGDFIYGGFLDGHFGHFLLESLSRMWWLRRAPAAPILWHCWQTELSAWQRDIFALLGIATDRFRFVETPISVERIVVAAPGFQIGLRFHADQEAALAVVPFQAPIPGRKLWLSRSELPSDREHADGEIEIEGRLRARGWMIVHPQKLSLGAQLAVLRDSETIAGFAGSAFHLLILARDCRARLRIVTRNGKLHPSFALIARGKGLRQRHLVVPPSPPRDPNEIIAFVESE